MKDEFDVTTSYGLKSAADFFREGSVLAWFINPLATALFAGEQLLKANSESTSVENQGKAAVEIIKQGKESGAKKIKVTIDQQAGANLNIPIDGVNISAMMGSNGKMTLEVEYA
ncbi:MULTISPECIES: hypothetical protein [unclassified Pseudomonas]|uniref:hypothetical protein n=1 Tax=unclassified Pseudomonas TaxID=196821 RepID=UPI000838D44D|nr:MULTISPECIES: hypothetical protein [unclassified Pseudomonas]QIH07606.1 hypothetical protein ATY02_13235 [Pseudomonas sp. BIOMIG1BAC]